MSVVQDWLRELHGHSPGYFNIIAFGGGKVKATRWYTKDQLGRAAGFVKRYGEEYDIYASCATHADKAEYGRGSLKTTHSIPGFWADIDIGTDGHQPAALPNPESEEQALTIIEGLPEPTALIHSGGGLQAWWLFSSAWVFEDPTAAQEASEDWHRMLVSRAEALGLHLDSVGDLPRIMRVAGAWNLKLEIARPVSLFKQTGTRYPAELLSSLGLPAEERTNSDGDGVPAHSFPLSWEEILAPHGYTFGGEDHGSGGRFVIRPGKKKSQGHSATIDPYGVPVYVNYSGSDPKLPSGAGQRLTKLKVYALLNHEGDLKAARKSLRKFVKETPESRAAVLAQHHATLVDFTEVWDAEQAEPVWVIEPLIEKGRMISLYSEAKAGKTLLVWEIILALTTGRTLFGQQPLLTRVFYVDKENTRRDVREKFGKMGYEGHELPGLAYHSFPDLAFLDTEEGAVEIHALASANDSELAVIDTLSRVLEGGENDSDTYHNFYKYTGVRLKADGITVVRLDHSGKDDSKGMRGSSAKTTDVDEVWHLVLDQDIVSLERTHSRSHHGIGEFELQRLDPWSEEGVDKEVHDHVWIDDE